MKKVSLLKTVGLFTGVFLLTASLFQCKKTGDLVKNLNRAYQGVADTTVFAPFYGNNVIATADVTPDVNDVIAMRGVQTIIKEYCATGNCHGGSIKPKFDTYADVMKYVTAGSPGSSKLWEMITTNDFDKAMPPVNSNHELTSTDKSIIYNWIVNGAKEKPDLKDFRPVAIRIIKDGCGSANCHNQATATGSWARKGLFAVTPADTTLYTYINYGSGAQSFYCLLTNNTIRDREWKAYKDSVKKFYADTINNITSCPLKTFTTPWNPPSPSPSIRGPLGDYDDIIMDIMYPKNMRSNSSVQFTNNGTSYYVKKNWLNSNDCFIRRIDSTLIYTNQVSLVAASKDGSMAWDDGGLKPSEVALIKAWYFADPNIPDEWKYGRTNTGIFKYRKTNNPIIRH